MHLLQERIEKQIAPMQRDVDHHRSITEEAIRAKEQAEERALVLESQLAQAEMVRALRARAQPLTPPLPSPSRLTDLPSWRGNARRRWPTRPDSY